MTDLERLELLELADHLSARSASLDVSVDEGMQCARWAWLVRCAKNAVEDGLAENDRLRQQLKAAP